MSRVLEEQHGGQGRRGREQRSQTMGGILGHYGDLDFELTEFSEVLYVG